MLLRYLTSGESHGPALTAIVEGLPAGLPLGTDYISHQLARRQGGYGRGGRMKIEKDRAVILSGVRGGLTIGSPITLQVENRDWANWRDIMSPETGASLQERVVTRPRPGHADLPGALKYGHKDIRNVLERASARETAARVAVGTVTRRLLEELGIEIIGFVVRIGSVAAGAPSELARGTGVDGNRLSRIRELIEASQLYCADSAAESLMMQEIDHARAAGDSLGGIFEVRAYGLPPGLGSYTHWDRRLDGNLVRSLMSIQAIKGVEIGLGFAGSAMFGSQAHDEIFYATGRGFFHQTNHAGGLEGGVTNGEPLIVRAAMKPIPTLYKPLRSVDLLTHESFAASVERADTCSVPAACVIGEAAVAWELAAACMEKFGGDTMDELKKNYNSYMDYIRQRSV